MFATDIGPFSNFNSAARAALQFLHERLGFRLWMVTRQEGEDWIVLQANDSGYGVVPGCVFCWSDSFCSRMVCGRGPRIAPHARSIPAYASAPIARQVEIGAYIGVPLTYADGTLFGTLCAIDPEPQPEAIVDEQLLLELIARLLSSLLVADLKAAEETRRAERAVNDAMTDMLTGLYNRRGWEHLLAAEEQRCQCYGHPAGTIFIDLDAFKQINDTYGHAAGDETIRRAGTLLRQTVRSTDVVARLGGDEFAVLAVECDETELQRMSARLSEAFARADIAASFGVAARDPSRGLLEACDRADRAMYADKQRRRAANLVCQVFPPAAASDLPFCWTI